MDVNSTVWEMANCLRAQIADIEACHSVCYCPDSLQCKRAINNPPPELVLRFGLMEGGGVIIDDGGGGRTR